MASIADGELVKTSVSSLRAQKRMTGVRYGLRADKLWWRITKEWRSRSEVEKKRESRAAAVDEAPHTLFEELGVR